MLSLFYGSDQILVRKEAYKLAEQKSPDSPLIRLEPESYEPGIIKHHCQNLSLFGTPSVFLIDSPSLLAIFQTECFESLPELIKSPDLFIWVDLSFTAAQLKILRAKAVELFEYKKVGQTAFSVFALAEAWLRRDKKTLWILLQTARREGLVAEELVGILWWQIKTARLASLTTSSVEAGVKDYPYKQAKQALKKFSSGELEKLSLELLTLYQAGHSGQLDINLALERWVLEN